MITNLDVLCKYERIWATLEDQAKSSNPFITGSNKVYALLDDDDKTFVHIIISSNFIAIDSKHTYTGPDNIENLLNFITCVYP